MVPDGQAYAAHISAMSVGAALTGEKLGEQQENAAPFNAGPSLW